MGRAFFVAAAIACAVPAAAQESVFALQFLGLSEESGDARARGMGLLGVALDDDNTAITLNPASLGRHSRMTVSVLGLAGSRTARDASSEDSRGLARFPHQRVALPLAGKVVVSAGFLALRNFQGDYQLPSQRISGYDYVQEFSRRGTLYTVPVGIAGAFGSRVRAGATLDFLFGTVDEAWTNRGDSLVAVRTRRRDRFGGQMLTLGVVVSPVPVFTVGASLTPGIDVTRTERTTIEDARLSSDALPARDASVERDVHWPLAFRGGATLRLGSRWRLGSDVLYRDWASYDGRLYGAESIGTEHRVGAGIEFTPRRGGFLGSAAYRAGLSRTTWPQRVGGARLRESSLHLGAGVPLRDGFGRLDFGFEYGKTGSRDRNGIEETSWRFLLGVSGQEIWRRKSPRT